MNQTPAEQAQPPAPPRAVAISGILLAVLYLGSLVLLRLAVPADPKGPGDWLADPAFRHLVSTALDLAPFTGLAFLWFMAVDPKPAQPPRRSALFHGLYRE